MANIDSQWRTQELSRWRGHFFIYTRLASSQQVKYFTSLPHDITVDTHCHVGATTL